MAGVNTDTVGPRRRDGAVRLRSRWRDGLLLAAVAAVLIFVAAPVFWVFVASFRSGIGLIAGAETQFTLANYTKIWENDFGRYLFNSLLICIVSVIICTAASACAAYVMSRYRFQYKKLLFAALVVSQLFPWVVLVTPLFILFANSGLLNTYAGIIFCYVAVTLPFSMYLMVGYLEAIPRDLDEAALMDGCSRLQVLTQIVFPLMVPGIVATATYSFLVVWSEFLLALALLTKTSVKTLPLGLALFFGEDTVDWGAVMAASALTALPALLLFLPVQSRLVSGLTSGSIKG